MTCAHVWKLSAGYSILQEECITKWFPKFWDFVFTRNLFLYFLTPSISLKSYGISFRILSCGCGIVEKLIATEQSSTWSDIPLRCGKWINFWSLLQFQKLRCFIFYINFSAGAEILFHKIFSPSFHWFPFLAAPSVFSFLHGNYILIIYSMVLQISIIGYKYSYREYTV